jgi:HEAT repeat protein
MRKLVGVIMNRAIATLGLVALCCAGCARPRPVAPPAAPKQALATVGQGAPTKPVQPPDKAELDIGPWVAVLEHATVPRRREVVEEIAQWGPRARKVLPALAKSLDVPRDYEEWRKGHPDRSPEAYVAAVELSNATVAAMIALGPDAAPALLDAIRACRGNPGRAAVELRGRAADAFRRWSATITPLLLDAAWDDVLDEPVEFALHGLDHAAVPALQKALGDRRPWLRLRAAVLLAGLGPGAANATGDLIAALDDPEANVRLATAYALCGRAADERDRAFAVLLEFFHAARPVTPRLYPLAGWSFDPGPWTGLAAIAVHRGGGIAGLAGTTTETRCWIAARLLTESGPKARVMLPRLAEWVEHDRSPYPPWATTLSRMGPLARGLAPPLIEMLRRTPARPAPSSRDADSLGGIRHALRSMGPSLAEDKRNLAALVALLKEEPESVGILAILRAVGPAAADQALPTLRDLLRHAKPAVRWRAFQTMTAVAPEAADAAIPALAGLRLARPWAPPNPVRLCISLNVHFNVEGGHGWPEDDQDLGADRDRLLKVVRALGPKDGAAIPVLVGLFATNRSSYEEQHAVLEFFGRLGPDDASAVVPVLLERLAGLQDYERPPLVRCLEHFGKAAVPDLAPALASKSSPVRQTAAGLLGKLGPDARAAVPELRAALTRLPGWERVAVAEALGRIGPDAAAAVPELIGLFKDANRGESEADRAGWRATVARALGRIGKTTVPALTVALLDAEPLTRAGAAEALGRVGPEAKSAVPILLRLRDGGTEPPEVRQAAGAALKVLDPD